MMIKLRGICIGRQCRNVPHSLNVMLKQHWAERLKWKKAWQNVIFYDNTIRIAAKSLKSSKRYIRVRLYTRYPQDQDNSVASVKYIIDALKMATIIKDDSPGLCDIQVHTQKVEYEEDEKTIVEII